MNKAVHRKDIEANAFAFELLMPGEMVEKEYQKLIDEGIFEHPKLCVMLAKKFAIENNVMNLRLIQLGLYLPGCGSADFIMKKKPK